MEDDDIVEIDVTPDAENLDTDINQQMQEEDLHTNILLVAATESNESLMTLIPMLAQDPEAYEFFKLDNPNPEFIRGQLVKAQEGLIENAVRGAIPFVGYYLDSAKRYLRLLSVAKNKSEYTAKDEHEELKFAKQKSYYLDVHSLFVNKVKALHSLSNLLQSSSKQLTNIDIMKMNQVMKDFGLEISLNKPQHMGKLASTATAAGFIGHKIYSVTILHKEYVQTIAKQIAGWEAPGIFGFYHPVKIARGLDSFDAYAAKSAAALVKVPFLATTILSSMAIGGATSALIGYIQKISFLPIGAKGWKSKDVAPALDMVIQLLNEHDKINVIRKDLAKAYKAGKTEIFIPTGGSGFIYSKSQTGESRYLEANYRLLVKLLSLYTKNVIQMSRGIYEIC